MIRLTLPAIPPSSNHAYENIPKQRLPNGSVIGGGRKLTEEGRAFLILAKTQFTQYHRKELLFFKPNTPYLLFVRYFFLAVENKGYPKTTETRYKKVDLGNRHKLLEDALKDAGGVDDSQTLSFVSQKMVGCPEHTILWVWALEEEETPFDGALRTIC